MRKWGCLGGTAQVGVPGGNRLLRRAGRKVLPLPYSDPIRYSTTSPWLRVFVEGVVIVGSPPAHHEASEAQRRARAHASSPDFEQLRKQVEN